MHRQRRSWNFAQSELRVSRILALCLALPLSGLVARPAAEANLLPKCRVGVMPFSSSGSKAPAGTDTLVTDLCTTELAQTARYTMVERSHLESALAEIGWQKADLVDASTAVAVGRHLGAQLVVVGSVTRLADAYSITARLVDVATAEVVIASSESSPDIGHIPGAISVMARHFIEAEDGVASKTLGAATALVAQRRLGAARTRFESIVSVFPYSRVSPDALLEIARLDLGAMQYADAAGHLNDLLDTFPAYSRSTEAMFLLAECYYLAVFPPPEAAEALLRDMDRILAVVEQPQDDRAAIRTKAALAKEARDLYRAVVRMDPKSPHRSLIDQRLRVLVDHVGD